MSNAQALASLAKFQNDLRKLPRTVAIEVAAASADVLTELAQSTFGDSEDAYGNSWAPGAEGQKVTLEKTGAIRRSIRYVATGTRLRVALGTKYAKYQVGKRPVTPRQGAALPVAYSQALARAAADVIKRSIGR